MSANTNNKIANTQKDDSKFICKDITKHPEYQKVLAVKDKKIRERMINCLKTKFKNGFDLRQFTQKFDQPNKSYVITKYETKTKKDSTETFNILYDEDGYKYFSKAKIDKYIEENNVPSEIPEGSMFTITTLDETFFMKDGEPIFYYPIECAYLDLGSDNDQEEPLLEDEDM